MRPQGIVGVVIIALLVIGSIIVGNMFFTHIIGVNVGALPPFFKFLVHATGAVFLMFAIKKIFIR